MQRRIMVVAAIATLVAAVAAWRGSTVGRREAAAKRERSVRNAVGGAPRTARPVFPYSVVPGGVATSDEAADWALRDTVVAAHYSDVKVAKLQPEPVLADRMVHVSYRKGDKVYWTSGRVRLRAGETILTDGREDIRARCGNRMSDTPKKPINLAAEPPEGVLDTPDMLLALNLDIGNQGLPSWRGGDPTISAPLIPSLGKVGTTGDPGGGYGFGPGGGLPTPGRGGVGGGGGGVGGGAPGGSSGGSGAGGGSEVGGGSEAGPGSAAEVESESEESAGNGPEGSGGSGSGGGEGGSSPTPGGNTGGSSGGGTGPGNPTSPLLPSMPDTITGSGGSSGSTTPGGGGGGGGGGGSNPSAGSNSDQTTIPAPQPTPEPSTYWIVGGALALFGLYKRAGGQR